jgi:hypothetical protein
MRDGGWPSVRFPDRPFSRLMAPSTWHRSNELPAARNRRVTRTKTDPELVDVPTDDEPMQFREWGTAKVYPLPSPYAGDRTIGSAADAWLQLQDEHQFVSRNHALLRYTNQRWSIVDAGSKNGLWIDGLRADASELTPGIEVTMGRVRLVVESPKTVAQRALVARFLGFDAARRIVVDRALRLVREWATNRMPLWIAGNDDLVSIARRMHDEFIGAHPFVVASVSGAASAIERVRSSGPSVTICLRSERPTRDLRAVSAIASEPGAPRIIVCAASAAHILPIEIPALDTRRVELPQIVDAYALDVIAALGARATSYTAVDRDAIVRWPLTTLADVEESVRRMIAIREFGGVTGAAVHIGVSHSSLSRWLARRTTNRRTQS